MRIRILAVGRMRPGPELDLTQDYLARFEKTGRGLGIGPAEVIEIDDRKASSPSKQAEQFIAARPDHGQMVALDERGRAITSVEFAENLARIRDAGCRKLVFAIGGADGLDPSVPASAEQVLSFGPMVWPHMLARVMLSEQLYRASAILARTPYHRE